MSVEVAACNSQQLWGWDVFHVLVRRTEAGSARALMLCAVDGFCVEGWGCFSSFFFATTLELALVFPDRLPGLPVCCARELLVG